MNRVMTPVLLSMKDKEARMSIDYNIKLYDKMSREYDLFLDNLKTKPPEDIIKSGYEIVVKEDILSIFEFATLPQVEAKSMYLQNKPLEKVYQEWLGNDYSYMDMLRDTVNDAVNKATIEYEDRYNAR